MNFFENMMELLLFDESISCIVKQDVISRITDWCESGGSETDDYIKKQYEYLLRVKEHTNNKRIGGNIREDFKTVKIHE